MGGKDEQIGYAGSRRRPTRPVVEPIFARRLMQPKLYWQSRGSPARILKKNPASIPKYLTYRPCSGWTCKKVVYFAIIVMISVE